MARLGQVLREARERKGCSFQEVERATGLWPEYVKALETEDFRVFTSTAHVRSSLRLYARHLGLSVKHVFALWEQTLGEQAAGVEQGPRTFISPLYSTRPSSKDCWFASPSRSSRLDLRLATGG